MELTRSELVALIDGEVGRYDDKGSFSFENHDRLISLTLKNPEEILINYERHLKENFLDDAKISDRDDPIEGKSRTKAVRKYYIYCENLKNLISKKSTPVRTDTPIFAPIA